LLASVFSAGIENNFLYLITFTGSFLCFVLPIFLINSYKKYLQLTPFIVGVVFFASLITILVNYDFLSIDFMDIQTSNKSVLSAMYASSGLFSSRGGYGIFLSIGLSLSLGYAYLGFQTKKSIIRWFTFLFISCVIAFSAISSGSRSTWLAVSIIICGFYVFILIRKFRLFSVAIFIPLGLALIIMFQSILLDSLSAVYSRNPRSIQQRIVHYEEAFEILDHNPFTGIGVGRYVTTASQSLGRVKVIHNFFLKIMLQFGVFSVIPLLLLFSVSFYLLIKSFHKNDSDKKLMSICLLLSLAGICCELMLYGGGGKQLWLGLGLANAYCNAIHHYHKKSVQADRVMA